MEFRRISFPTWPKRLRISQWLSYPILILIVCLGALLTLFAYQNEQTGSAKWLQEHFRVEAEDYVHALQKTIDCNLDDVATLAMFHQASQDVNRQEFLILAHHLITRNPCLQALEWLQRVPDDARNAWEQAARRDGYPGFQISERDENKQMRPAARRPEYYAIYYIEPLKGNEAALGYDPSSEPTRRTALEKSRDTGTMVASDWIKMVQSPDQELGCVVSAPVYRIGLPTGSVAERRKAMQGFAVGVINIKKILNDAWGGKWNEGIQIQIEDLSTYSAQPPRGILISAANSGRQDDETQQAITSPLQKVSSIRVADHAWRVQCSATPSYITLHRREKPFKTLLIGLCFTTLLSVYIYYLIKLAEHARRHAAELAHSQAELRESRERFAGIISMANDAIISVDERLRIILFNHGAERSFQYTAEEVLGRPLGLLVPQLMTGPVQCESEAPADDFKLEQKISLGKQPTHGLRKDGKEFPAEASISRLKMGGAMILTIILRDKTEELLLESQLRHAQKMEAVGQLAGGVAHDFNNILTVILGNASLLLSKLPRGKEFDLLDAIQDAAIRATGVTRQLLSFSRKQVVQMQPLDLNRGLAEMHKVLTRLIGEDIRMTVRLGEGLWTIRADSSQIDQVIFNLVVNARDAMPDGGELRIVTSNVVLPRRIDTLHGTLPPGRYVLLTVQDAGMGMDETTQARIFEPFFTTKEKGRGTGLGLATVYGIVNQIGGTIVVESKPGLGSTFRVYFPQTEEAPANQGEGGAPNEMPTLAMRARILAVEDDDLLRNFILHALQHWGVSVTVASGGEEALGILKAQSDQFDLLLTDVVMPGLNGAELADRVAAENPKIKILFMSGYARDIKGNRLLTAAEDCFIAKPFTARELIMKIQKILNQDGPECCRAEKGPSGVKQGQPHRSI